MRELAEEVIGNEEEFEKGSFGKADAILDKFYGRLYPICLAYSNLRMMARVKKPQGDQPLRKDQFRCFGCGGVIEADDEECQLCHWTWK